MKAKILILAVWLPLIGFAQHSMTLQQCIDTALTNSLTLERQRQQTELQQLQYRQARQNLLPTVSGNASQSWSFGRATGVDNITRSQNMASTQVGLNANITLFDGLKMKYNIDQTKAQMLGSEADLQKVTLDIQMNITAMYLQVVLNKELLRVATDQTALTQQQIARTKTLVQEGRLAAGELYTLRSRLAKEELSRVNAENNLRLALLDLAQAMELNHFTDFDIVDSEISDEPLIEPLEDICSSALQNRPEIQAAQYQLQASQTALKSTKSSYSPTLSAGANLGTGYYHLYGSDNERFGKQLSDNFQTGVGISLQVPIFDRMQTPNAVRRQRIAIQQAEVQLEQTKKDLLKQIEQAYYNALSAQAQATAAEKAAEAAQEEYRYATEKFEAGRANAYEYYEAKNTYTKALSEQLQAKYNYLFKCRILAYYKD